MEKVKEMMGMLENTDKISTEEYCVLMVIMCRIVGFSFSTNNNKRRLSVPFSLISRVTGFKKPKVRKTVRKLVALGLV